MERYTKKPVTISAIRTPERGAAPSDELVELVASQGWGADDDGIVISTLEGDHLASPGDWIIKGIKGEFYPCKPDIFEATYDALTAAYVPPAGLVDFGGAIRAAKAGYKIAREGWNGKNMFVVYMPPLYLPPFNTQDTSRKVNDRTAKWIGEDKPLDCQPYFAMYNAQEQWIPGWLASQSDMLAEDWQVVG